MPEDKKGNSGHRARLRARFMKAPELLPEYELLELLLGYVLLRRDTKPLAKKLLAEFSSLRGLLDAREEELIAVEGIGPGIQTFIKTLHELIARYEQGPLRDREILCTPQSVARIARARLGRYSHEEVWAAYVDNNNRLLSWQKLAKGSVNMSVITPRDVIEQALRLKATGFMLVHNHPGGSTNPSGADLNLTAQLKEAAKTLNIRFLDHLIVSDSDCYSLMEEQLI